MHSSKTANHTGRVATIIYNTAIYGLPTFLIVAGAIAMSCASKPTSYEQESGVKTQSIDVNKQANTPITANDAALGIVSIKPIVATKPEDEPALPSNDSPPNNLLANFLLGTGVLSLVGFGGSIYALNRKDEREGSLWVESMLRTTSSQITPDSPKTPGTKIKEVIGRFVMS